MVKLISWRGETWLCSCKIFTVFRRRFHALHIFFQDFKKTMKVTWIADTNEEEMIPVVGVDYDHIISKVRYLVKVVNVENTLP